MRKQGNCPEKEIMQGTMSGARRRGRPRTAWMDNINIICGYDSQWKSQSKRQRTDSGVNLAGILGDAGRMQKAC